MNNQREIHEILLAVDGRIRQALLQFQRGAGSVPSLDSILSTFVGDLTANARVGVRKNSTGSTYKRRSLNLIEGSNITLTVADDSGDEEVDITIEAAGGGGGGGPSFGQTIDYPETFTGDVIDGSSTTPFVDVSAFDTKQVVNSRILQLVTLGPSKDQRVRITLGTTKAGAFDVTVCLAFSGMYWSALEDTYAEVRLATSADAQIAIARILPEYSSLANGTYLHVNNLRVGGSSMPSSNTQVEPPLRNGETLTLRFVRDGSNVITFYYGFGTAPMALAAVLQHSNDEIYTQTVSGTLARVEIAMHTPSGPGSNARIETFVDYVASR